MIISKKISLFIIPIFVMVITENFCCFHAFAKNQERMSEGSSANSQFSKWFQWKIQTKLTEKQKNVMECLKKSSTIFNKAFDTRCVQPESEYGYPNPKEAIAITEQAIKELKVLPCPRECVPYRDATIRIMKNIIIYHQLRLTFKEGTDEFNLRYEKFQISEIKSGFDVKQYNEYFGALRKIGLFDNIEEELKSLGLNNEKALVK